MTTTNVALAAVIGVLVAGGSLVAAPVAKADIDIECQPGCWGAIAASASVANGQLQLILNRRTQQRAEDDAVMWCDIYGKTNDCEVVTSGMGCLSIAQTPDSVGLAGRVAPTQDAADAAALDAAGPGSKIDLNGCN